MKNQRYLCLRILEMIIGVSITALGLACMMKSGLGQTAITSFTQNITMITGIKSGTVLIIFFLSCTLLQIILLRKEFEKIQLLQVIVALIQGKIVNLICYEVPVIKDYVPSSYFEQWCFVLLGIVCCSYGVAVLFKAELIRNPFEELAMVLSKKLHMDFSIFRVRIDMFFMAISILMIILFQLDLTTIREGTWASMILLGKSMKYTFPLAEYTSLYYRKTHDCSIKKLV